MQTYIERKIVSGAMIEVIKYTKTDGSKKSRKRNTELTSEQMQYINDLNAVNKLDRLIYCNFFPGDLHVVLTYGRQWGKNGPSVDEAKKCYKRFLYRLRKYYKELGKECKYISATEYKGKRLHHHFILEAIPLKELQDLWEEGNPKATPLYSNGDFKDLAEYFVKETKRTRLEDDAMFGKRWNSSRNLKKPEPPVDKEVKRTNMDKPPKIVEQISKGKYKKYQSMVIKECECRYDEFFGEYRWYVRIIDMSKLGRR